MPQMPTIDLRRTSLTGRDREIASACLNKGVLRASKPTSDGEAMYVWRMTAFAVSPKREHQCFPATAEFDLPAPYWPPTRTLDSTKILRAAELRKARIAELDKIVDAMINVVSPTDWHGVRRWGNALGLIGQPMTATHGATVYR